jgi:hypothetical protein
MADDQDNQSLGHDKESSSQETSNQGASISFNVEGDLPAIGQPLSMVSKYEAMAKETR